MVLLVGTLALTAEALIWDPPKCLTMAVGNQSCPLKNSPTMGVEMSGHHEPAAVKSCLGMVAAQKVGNISPTNHQEKSLIVEVGKTYPMRKSLTEAVESSCLSIVEVGSTFRGMSPTAVAEKTSHVILTAHQAVNICTVMSLLTVPGAERISLLVQTMNDGRYQTEATTSLRLMMIKAARCFKWNVLYLIHGKN